MPGRVLPKPDAGAERTIRWSRVVSYVLVVLAAIVFSMRPELFGDPQSQPAHALLHVWRIVVGIVLGVAALGVQVLVGVRWRNGLRRAAADE
ncbi:putative membrane protein [Curtobacterium sp. PvP017]